MEYRRSRQDGGTCFFAVNLAERSMKKAMMEGSAASFDVNPRAARLDAPQLKSLPMLLESECRLTLAVGAGLACGTASPV